MTDWYEEHAPDWLKCLLAGLAIAVIVGSMITIMTVGIIWAAVTLDGKQCHAKAAEMKLESQYSFWTECMVQVRGQWVPLHSVRVAR